MPFQLAGAPAIYFDTGSDTCNVPACTSCIMATAINCLLTEPILYTVVAVAGTFHSIFALP